MTTRTLAILQPVHQRAIEVLAGPLVREFRCQRFLSTTDRWLGKWIQLLLGFFATNGGTKNKVVNVIVRRKATFIGSPHRRVQHAKTVTILRNDLRCEPNGVTH